MSRTTRVFKNQTLRDKSRRKTKDKKFFGYTSGTHSRFELLSEGQKQDHSYAVKGIHYIKYGYGNRVSKQNRNKNYKKVIQ